MTMRLARCALVSFALAGLVACGGGGGDKETPTPAPEPMSEPMSEPTPTPEPAPGQMPEMRIMPKPDEPGTIDSAVAITGDDPVSGNLSSPTDVDMFRLALDEPSTVTFWTTGEAETVVTLVDGDGNNLSAAGAGTTNLTTGTGATFAAVAVPADSAGRVSVTTALDDVYARVTGQADGQAGDYDLHHEETANLAPRLIKSFSAITVKAGGAAATVDLSEFFSDPEGGALTFSTKLPAGSIGPVSLGVSVSGTILNVLSPSGLTPGPVSVTVTATDPFGLITAEVLSVTVQPADNPNPEGASGPNDLNGCVNPTFRRTGDGFGEGCPYSHHADMTNGCSITIFVRYAWGEGPAGLALSIRPGQTDTASDFCERTRRQFRFCVHPDNPSDLPSAAYRCTRDNAPWQTR